MKLKTTAHTSQTTLMPPHIYRSNHMRFFPLSLSLSFSISLFCWHLNGMKFRNNSELSHRIWHVGAQYGLIWATTREHTFRIRSPYNGACLALGYFYFSNGCHSLESFVTWILRPVTSTQCDLIHHHPLPCRSRYRFPSVSVSVFLLKNWT